MSVMSMVKDVKWTHGAAAATAATTDIDTGVVDMSQFDSIAAKANTGDATSGSVLRISIWGNTASSTSSPTPVEIVSSSQFTAGTSDADSKILVAEKLKWPAAYRYAFARVERDTQNCVVDSVDIMQFNARTVPVTQSDAIIAYHA